MAANTKPIFTASPDIGFFKGMTAAYTSMVLGSLSTNTAIKLLYTAGADGAYVQKVRFRSLGTNTATVGRIWIGYDATNVTSTNSFLYEDVSLPATTASATAAQTTIEIPMNIALGPNHCILATLGSGTSPGYDVSVIAGTYTL